MAESGNNPRHGIHDDGLHIWIKYVVCKKCKTSFDEPSKCPYCEGYDFEEFDLVLHKIKELSKIPQSTERRSGKE